MRAFVMASYQKWILATVFALAIVPVITNIVRLLNWHLNPSEHLTNLLQYNFSHTSIVYEVPPEGHIICRSIVGLSQDMINRYGRVASS